jgi:hypothetical protein
MPTPFAEPRWRDRQVQHPDDLAVAPPRGEQLLDALARIPHRRPAVRRALGRDSCGIVIDGRQFSHR